MIYLYTDIDGTFLQEGCKNRAEHISDRHTLPYLLVDTLRRGGHLELNYITSRRPEGVIHHLGAHGARLPIPDRIIAENGSVICHSITQNNPTQPASYTADFWSRAIPGFNLFIKVKDNIEGVLDALSAGTPLQPHRKDSARLVYKVREDAINDVLDAVIATVQNANHITSEKAAQAKLIIQHDPSYQEYLFQIVHVDKGDALLAIEENRPSHQAGLIIVAGNAENDSALFEVIQKTPNGFGVIPHNATQGLKNSIQSQQWPYSNIIFAENDDILGLMEGISKISPKFENIFRELQGYDQPMHGNF